MFDDDDIETTKIEALPVLSDDAEGEACPVCDRLATEWNDDLRRFIHSECVGEFLFYRGD